MDDYYDGAVDIATVRDFFQQGNYAKLIQADTSQLDAAEEVEVDVYKLRAQIAQGEAALVAANLKGKPQKSPAQAMVLLLAEYVQAPRSDLVDQARELVQISSDDMSVQVVGATILQLAGLHDEALKILKDHPFEPEHHALTVQILLSAYKTQPAQKLVDEARKHSDDRIAYQLAESWVQMCSGGPQVEDASYLMEELANTPSSSTALTLTCLGVNHLLLNQASDAADAFQKALAKDPNYVDALANAIVAASILRSDAVVAELKERLEFICPSHRLLRDISEKSALFDASMAKYTA